MIPELGHFAAVLALVMALVQSVFPLVGAHQGRRQGAGVFHAGHGQGRWA